MLTHKWRFYRPPPNIIILFCIFSIFAELALRLFSLATDFLQDTYECVVLFASHRVGWTCYTHNSFRYITSTNHPIKRTGRSHLDTALLLIFYSGIKIFSLHPSFCWYHIEFFLAVSELCKKIYVVYCNNDHN